MYCNCLKPLPFREALGHLKDEAKEFFEKPSMDEFSDCAFGIGRLVASLFGKVYVRMPFDSLHKKKIDERMKEFGCVRSRAHLVNGKCPSI